MLGKLKQYLFGFNKVAGVEINLSGEDGSVQIKLVHLSLKNNLLSIEDIKEFSGLDNLKNYISVDTPISLVITGKGIITRKVAEAEISEQNNFIDKIFPNANSSEFYIQKISGEEYFISLIRRNKVDELIKEIEEHSFNIVSVSLGPFSVIEILPLIGVSHHGSFSFAGHQFILKGNLVSDYKSVSRELPEREILIDKEKINESFLIAYSIAFNQFSGNSEVSIEEEAYTKSKDEFNQKKIFKALSKIAGGFLLFVLILNIYFYFNLSSEYESLRLEEGRYKAMLNQMDILEKQVTEKESFLKQAGWLTFSKASYYSDRIASTVPSEIKLSEMAMNPINDKLSKSERKLIFSSGSIKLTGNCRNPTDLNPWIKKLKLFDWVKEVAIQSYFYNEKNREGIFNIEISIK